ncbi:hypothetical protein [Kaistia adipata]|uniref:hypothetical protein n=1 Tax=Kaistia adipata TaxID=166954 RepID=UPI0006890006|nr:hypothetical protein [Kaistia adipata]
MLRRARIVPVLVGVAIPLAAQAIGLGAGASSSSQDVPAAMELPAYLAAARDPASGTEFTRITRPGPLGGGIVCREAYCSHRYSSSQAWNADASLLVLANGCNGLCFLDGQTYEPLFRRARATECEWHPVDPDLMICVGGQSVSTWAPRANREEPLFYSTDYLKLQFGPYKGNPSLDGHRIAVRAKRKDGALVVFAFDLATRKKFPDIDLSQLPGTNNACTISPLGGNILCLQSTEGGIDQAYVFTVDGALTQRWTEHHRPGHGDLTVDSDGSEVYVGISKSDPDQYQIIKRRLSDGRVTSLMPYGEGQHVSLRAIRRPGWIIVSYAGDPAVVFRHPGWAPYAREVIALRLDGSGEVRRIAQTHNVPFDYWSETHASPSPDASQVIWSSNWGNPGGPVLEFVSRLEWPAETGVGPVGEARR